MKEKDAIFKLKKELCVYLEENGFKKRLDDQIPDRIYYVTHQDQSELSFEFPKDVYSSYSMKISIFLPRFGLKFGMDCGYDMYEQLKDRFLNFIDEALAKEYKEFLQKEIRKDLK